MFNLTGRPTVKPPPPPTPARSTSNTNLTNIPLTAAPATPNTSSLFSQTTAPSMNPVKFQTQKSNVSNGYSAQQAATSQPPPPPHRMMPAPPPPQRQLSSVSIFLCIFVEIRSFVILVPLTTQPQATD